MWRAAIPSDDENIVSMCMALNADDPGPAPVVPQQVRRTLTKLRDEPYRGCAVVCEHNGHPAGYALLIAFWSNEFGGEVCVIDELFVAPAYRGLGLATELLTTLADSKRCLWPANLAALALEVSPANDQAKALYERLGFRGDNLAMWLRLPNK
jgi:ribosomal protein S18 acetylase RimI-like enzyme